MKLERSKLVKWENEKKHQIVWMVLDDDKTGVVLHCTGGIVRVGSTWNLSASKDISPFIGNLNINSQAS